MKKFLFLALIAAAVTMSSSPAFADRVYVGIGGGPGYYRGGPGYYHGGGWGPYYDYGYYGRPAYYDPGYYGYAPYYPYAPPAPVVYQAPPQPVVVAPPQPAPVSTNANQTSQTYTDGSGRTCREYQSASTIGGQEEQTYGTACLQPDGTWRVISQQ